VCRFALTQKATDLPWNRAIGILPKKLPELGEELGARIRGRVGSAMNGHGDSLESEDWKL
jgi:hypothetical protein